MDVTAGRASPAPVRGPVRQGGRERPTRRLIARQIPPRGAGRGPGRSGCFLNELKAMSDWRKGCSGLCE